MTKYTRTLIAVLAPGCVACATFRHAPETLGAPQNAPAFGYTPLEYRDALHAIAEGKLDCSPLITGTVGLGGVDAAFTALGDPEKHAKILIDPASASTLPH